MSRYYDVKRLKRSGAHSVEKRADHAQALRGNAIEVRRMRRHHWFPVDDADA